MKAARPRLPLVLTIIALLCVPVLAACGGGSDGGAAAQVSSAMPTSPFTGIVREPAPEVGSLSLPAVSDGGQPFPLKGAPDGVLLLYLGFTHCPDICPTTMADLRGAIRRLPAAEQERITVAFATVDPDRDTPKVLTGYIRSFFPAGVALRTTDAAELRRVADRLAADYGVERNAKGEIEVVHTAFLYAIGPDGRLIVQWPFGASSEAMADDLQAVFDQLDNPTDEETSP